MFVSILVRSGKVYVYLMETDQGRLMLRLRDALKLEYQIRNWYERENDCFRLPDLYFPYPTDRFGLPLEPSPTGTFLVYVEEITAERTVHDVLRDLHLVQY